MGDQNCAEDVDFDSVRRKILTAYAALDFDSKDAQLPETPDTVTPTDVGADMDYEISEDYGIANKDVPLTCIEDLRELAKLHSLRNSGVWINVSPGKWEMVGY